VTERFPLDAGPGAFIGAYSKRVRELRIASNEAYWRFTAEGRPEAQEQVERLETEISDLHSDPQTYAALVNWHASTTGDPLLDRQIDLVRVDYRSMQIDQQLRVELVRRPLAIEETCSTFRPQLDGYRMTNNGLDRVLLSESDDRRRRTAWEATREIGARVADEVRELVKLRNEQARALGFDDYFALALDDQEMTSESLFGVLDDLRARTDAPWARRKAALDAEFGALRGKSPDSIQPWDYTDRFLQSVPRADPGRSTDAWFDLRSIERYAKRFFSGIGLPIDRIWAVSDMYPRDGKFPHAYCMGVDNPSRVRVLCNLDATTRWMETTLHEFGHAVYNAGVDPELPYLLREAAHTFMTEAVAMFFGRLARDEQWLRAVPGVEGELAVAARERLAESQMVFVRWAMAVTYFERSMYEDPDQDLDARWWSVVESLQGLRRPDGWGGNDWASKVHIACYPAYYQNYILGELLASQFGAALGAELGAEPSEGLDLVGRDAVGRFFGRLFKPGMRHAWPEAIEHHTGSPLSAHHWVTQFGTVPTEA
jgi:peptidyl-dipeptidase A